MFTCTENKNAANGDNSGALAPISSWAAGANQPDITDHLTVIAAS